MAKQKATQFDPKTGKVIRQVEVVTFHVSSGTVEVRALNGPMRGTVYEVPRFSLLIDGDSLGSTQVQLDPNDARTTIHSPRRHDHSA